MRERQGTRKKRQRHQDSKSEILNRNGDKGRESVYHQIGISKQANKQIHILEEKGHWESTVASPLKGSVPRFGSAREKIGERETKRDGKEKDDGKKRASLAQFFGESGSVAGSRSVPRFVKGDLDECKYLFLFFPPHFPLSHSFDFVFFPHLCESPDFFLVLKKRKRK